MRGALGMRAFICIFMVLAAFGCTNSASNDEIAPEFVAALPGADTKNLDWVAENMKLTCSIPEGCPPQVGVLIFASRGKNGGAEIQRCTASLIEPGTEIVSAGHCDFTAKATGYFITRTDLPKKMWRKVTLGHKQHTVNAKQEKHLSHRPDFALFKLESPIVDIKGYKFPPAGELKPYRDLIAYVVKPVAGETALTLQIGKIECQIRRHERYFPFDILERPDVITAFNCSGQGGNSGGPMIAAGTQNVEAIFAGTKDKDEFFAKIRSEDKREPFPYEMHSTVTATNVRCLDFAKRAGSRCVEATEAEMTRRFVDTQAETLGSLRERHLPAAAQFATAFTNYVNPVRKDNKTGISSLELMYYPACRLRDVQSVLVPIELIEIKYDEWARPTLMLRSTYVSEGHIFGRVGDMFTVQVGWVASPVRYDQPDKDPRQRLTGSFSIALPPCAR